MPRRLLRIAFNTLTVLSLVLAVVAVPFWYRSLKWSEAAVHYGPVGTLGMTSSSGRLSAYGFFAWDTSAQIQIRYDFEKVGRSWGSRFFGASSTASGFDFATRSLPGIRLVYIAAPHWFLIVVAAALPVFRVAMSRRGKKASENHHCATCNYDLRATPDRCPECGAVACVK